jgi:NAD(P)-dependent dehydrogenase (short-subunit alcohol dehydrogenase family)
VCLITGGTRGIGLATAHRFLMEKAKAVIICSSREENVKRAIQTLHADKSLSDDARQRVQGYKCDVGISLERK